MSLTSYDENTSTEYSCLSISTSSLSPSRGLADEWASAITSSSCSSCFVPQSLLRCWKNDMPLFLCECVFTKTSCGYTICTTPGSRSAILLSILWSFKMAWEHSNDMACRRREQTKALTLADSIFPSHVLHRRRWSALRSDMDPSPAWGTSRRHNRTRAVIRRQLPASNTRLVTSYELLV